MKFVVFVSIKKVKTNKQLTCVLCLVSSLHDLHFLYQLTFSMPDSILNKYLGKHYIGLIVFYFPNNHYDKHVK